MADPVVLGYFERPADLLHACEHARKAEVGKVDAHTPFPVHGLDAALGLRPSRLPFIVLGAAILGGTGAFTLQWWVHSVAYPQVISGKPLFAFQAYVPVTFELTILAAAFACFFGLWGLCKLPRFFHPVMQHPGFARASDDRFFISIEAPSPERARRVLEEVGAQGIAEVAS